MEHGCSPNMSGLSRPAKRGGAGNTRTWLSCRSTAPRGAGGADASSGSKGEAKTETAVSWVTGSDPVQVGMKRS